MSDLTVHYWMIPGLAVGLDFLLGDPKGMPHPVRLIGCLANMVESTARSASGPKATKTAGALAALALAACVGGAVYMLTHIGALGFFVALYLAFAGLALSCLISEVKYVNRLLDAGQLTEAKVALSMLVSRETDNMGTSEVRRALSETLSENLNDGFIAPLFWLCIGGPVAMWVYKTFSTLDSMWGYKTERYREFGWFAAKMDDVLAYIPARITALGLYVCGVFMSLNTAQALKYFAADARSMASPNAGWPMAVSAWLMDAQMGGTATYFGKTVKKPVLGPEGAQWTSPKLRTLVRLCRATGIGLAALAQILVIVFSV